MAMKLPSPHEAEDYLLTCQVYMQGRHFFDQPHLPCIICSRTYTTSAHLARHKSTIHPDGFSTLFTIGGPHTCTSCTQIFDSKLLLDNHIATVHGCPECHKILTGAGSMASHRRNAHKGYLCPGCSRRFPSRVGLRQHQRSNC